MARRHLEAETLARLAARDLGRSELQAAAWHLYKCRHCRRRVRQALADGEAVLARLFDGVEPIDVRREKDYSGAFARAAEGLAEKLAARQRADRSVAERVETLLGRSFAGSDADGDGPTSAHLVSGAGLDAALADPSWSLATQLLEACRRRWSQRPGEAEELARLALETARRLPEDAVHPGLRADLEARAWAYAANCRRIAFDLRGAGQAFARAHQRLAEGSGDPGERARILDLEASLLRDRRRFAEAHRRIEEAIRLYRSIGDVRGEARVRVKQATVLSYAGEADRAVEASRRALERIDEATDPHLRMTTTSNLAIELWNAGRLDELAALRPEQERLVTAHGDAEEHRRLAWFDGVVARDDGRLEEAEERLVAVRERYAEAGATYEAALVSLDLAVLLVEQGRAAETRELAREMLPIFESQEIHREALAALVLFRQAALAEELSGTLARRTAAALRRDRRAAPPARPPLPS